MITIEQIQEIRSLFKRGEVVLLDGRVVIFVCIGKNLTATLFFENGNIWNHPLEKVQKFNGNVKQNDFARQVKLKFYGIKNFRRNFDEFL